MIAETLIHNLSRSIKQWMWLDSQMSSEQWKYSSFSNKKMKIIRKRYVIYSNTCVNALTTKKKTQIKYQSRLKFLRNRQTCCERSVTNCATRSWQLNKTKSAKSVLRHPSNKTSRDLQGRWLFTRAVIFSIESASEASCTNTWLKTLCSAWASILCRKSTNRLIKLGVSPWPTNSIARMISASCRTQIKNHGWVKSSARCSIAQLLLQMISTMKLKQKN